MNNKDKATLLFKDVRFWIVLFFLIRLYGITFPPLELSHSWRQTDGLMIARNFYERDPNIFYPTIDSAGEKSGIVGCEFPLLNYLISIVSLVFGYEHWYGRMIVLISTSFGIFFFYKLIKRYFGEASAFNSSILLLASLWFSYSRKNIPDTFAVSFCLVSLYCAFVYLESGKIPYLLLFFVLGLFGCLSKILAATILTVLLIPILDPKKEISRKLALTFCSLLILSGVYWWYFVWVPHLETQYGSGGHFFMGLSFAEGARDIMNNWSMVLRRLYISPLKYGGCLVFVIAILLIIIKKQWIQLSAFLLPYLAFLVLLVKTGANVVSDNYYVLTMIPAFAFIIGCALASIENKKIAVVLLIVVASESIGDQIYDFRIRQPFKSLSDLEPIMDAVSSRNDLVAVNGEYENPTFLYFAHRRGWVAPNDYLSDSTYFNNIKSNGCKYVVVAKKLYGDLNLEYPVVHESEYFKIYDIK